MLWGWTASAVGSSADKRHMSCFATVGVCLAHSMIGYGLFDLELLLCLVNSLSLSFKLHV